MSENPGTSDLIRVLAKNASRESASNLIRRSRLRFRNYTAAWLFGAAVIVAISFWFLPAREDLRERFTALESLFLYTLWMLATILPALKVYTLAFPNGEVAGSLQRFAKYAAAPLVILGLYSVANLRFADFAFQIYREGAAPNGGCGIVIFAGGMIHAGFLLHWIRRGATTAPIRAGVWAALSTAAFASFIVQFACPNEHPLHVILWHFVPMFALTILASMSARRLLKW